MKLTPEQLKQLTMPIDGKQAILQPIRARFRPLLDITAYELATLLPYYLGLAPLFEEDWTRLGPDVTRHMERADQPKQPEIVT